MIATKNWPIIDVQDPLGIYNTVFAFEGLVLNTSWGALAPLIHLRIILQSSCNNNSGYYSRLAGR